MNRKFDFSRGSWAPGILILVLAVTAVWSARNLLRVDEGPSMPRVSVIVEDSSSDRWTAFRLGLDQAAAEYGVDVSFAASASFEGPEDQKNLISQEISNGAEALILVPCGTEDTDILPEGVSETRKIVYVQSDVVRDISPDTAVVKPPAGEMGRALGEMLLEQCTGPSIVVLAEDTERYSRGEVLQGLRETVEGAGGSIFVMETEGEVTPDILAGVESHDLIAVIGDSLLEQTAALIAADSSGRGRLFGIGCSPSSISWLDRGVISGMIIPNDFTMGYQSLARLAQRLSNDIPVMEDLETGYTCVYTDQVHDSEMEKLLFPLVQ